jgi:hypothetical protein
MIRAGVAALVLSAVGLEMAGCAESYCANPDHQFEDICQLNDGGSVSAFTITPARIAINKDFDTSVTIAAYTSFANMLVTVTQDEVGAKPLAIGSVSKEGMLTVKVQGTGNGAAPSWVGISADANKKILTLNEYAIATIAKQAVGEYSFDANNQTLGKSTPLLFSAYNSTPYADMATRGIALSMTDFVIPEYGNATTSLLTKCSLAGTCSGSTAVKYGTIASLSAAASGQLYAGLFNMKVLAFADSDLTTGISIGGTSSSTTSPVLVAVYNANDDGHPDVSIWHGDGNVSVALSDSAGKSLTYTADDSAALKRAAGLTNAAPDAVAAGDIDQDGLDDFVIAKGHALYILTNLGGGQFAASDAVAIPGQGPMGNIVLTPVSAIAIGDLSADSVGLKDLVLSSKANRAIAVMENSATLR